MEVAKGTSRLGVIAAHARALAVRHNWGQTITYETGGKSEKDVMVKDPERSLIRTHHLAVRNLMDPNEIMKLAPDTLLLRRVGENPQS